MIFVHNITQKGKLNEKLGSECKRKYNKIVFY